jgi:hypothetical protein
MATSTLPPGCCDPSLTSLIEPASWLRSLVGAEKHHKRSNVIGLERLNHLLGHDGAGHARTGIWRDCVYVDVVLLSLKGKRPGETKDTALSRGIVGLAEVTVDTAG